MLKEEDCAFVNTSELGDKGSIGISERKKASMHGYYLAFTIRRKKQLAGERTLAIHIKFHVDNLVGCPSVPLKLLAACKTSKDWPPELAARLRNLFKKKECMIETSIRKTALCDFGPPDWDAANEVFKEMETRGLELR
eukprot:gene4925-4169_t